MSDFFTRLSNLVQDFFENDLSSNRSSDPLFNEAWQELEAELNKNKKAYESSEAFKKKATTFEDMDKTFEEFDSYYKAYKNDSKTGKEEPLRKVAQQLVQDYHNLELKPGADKEAVNEAYKRLMKEYHPDRFSSNPQKQELAHQICIKLNESRARLLKHLSYEN